MNRLEQQGRIPIDWQTLTRKESYGDFSVPFYEAIDLKQLEDYLGNGNYIVVFESTRKANAVTGVAAELLEQADQAAIAELQEASGFMYYFRGQLTPERKCRAFCIWEDIETAKVSAQLPKHKEAAKLSSQFYEVGGYTVKGFEVNKSNGKTIFSQVIPRRS